MLVLWLTLNFESILQKPLNKYGNSLTYIHYTSHILLIIMQNIYIYNEHKYTNNFIKKSTLPAPKR